MPSKREIETVIRNLEIPTNQETDEWILANVMREFESVKRRTTDIHSSHLWRKIMKNPWTILTTAAAALFAVVLGIHYFNSNQQSHTVSANSETNVDDDNGTVLAISTPDKTPLQIDLPNKIIRGTEKNVRISPLERYVEGKRPPFLVPLGTQNVALGKSVTSSDPMPIIGDLEMITDGDKEGYDGYWVELGPGSQWIQIDLKKQYSIYAILIWHYFAESRASHDVIIQTADDPDFIMGVQTLFNNDRDNSSGQGVGEDLYFLDTYEGKLIDAKGIKTRYVRLYSNGNTANDDNFYIEVEVYGK
jgi:hypothetical protein